MEDQRRGRRGAVETNVRTAAVWAAVREVVVELEQQLRRPLRVVDLGGGTGGLAVPLAGLGHHVTVIDPSPDALAALTRRAGDAALEPGAGRIDALQGDADGLADLVPAGGADLVCCHGMLELVDDPAATVRAVATVLAPGGYLSLVVAQRLAAVLARAVAGRFTQAERALTSQDGRFGDADPVPRRYDMDEVADLVTAAGLEIRDAHGVRLFSDLVDAAYQDTDADRAALLALEQAVARHPRYAFLGQLGAAMHLLARRR
ncbi:MAG TPA: methyltransferase domain-containing protein [Dermatophilaceae bacterium]|nr:methyltransferase domain-containing protein [Dermatophilaceae bacterium]